MNLYFTNEICDLLDLYMFGTPMVLKNVHKRTIQRRRPIPIGNTKFSRRLPRSVEDAELGHFTLLFRGGRQRNVQRFITHVHSYIRDKALV